ncbi:MAG TPA: hypothetical protein VFB00_06820 [Terriglobales bacterium]|nr:hypothetical protein [Terriglobales bacterium]
MAEPKPGVAGPQVKEPRSSWHLHVRDQHAVPKLLQQCRLKVERGLAKGSRQVSDAFRQMKSRVDRLCDQRPLQIIGAVAVVAILAGAGLRMWRNQR